MLEKKNDLTVTLEIAMASFGSSDNNLKVNKINMIKMALHAP